MLKRVVVGVFATLVLASSGAVVYLLASQPKPQAAPIQPTATVTVTVTPSLPQRAPSPELTSWFVTAKTCLNVREQPNARAAVLTCAPFRSELQGSSFSASWLKVAIDEGWGYASVTHVSKTRPPKPPPKPRGYVTYERGGDYGQGFPSGRCANWTVKWINNSNTEVVQIIFDSPSGSYHSGPYDAGRDYPAKDPKPAVVDVSIPANSSQVTRFQTCTSTPQPTPDADFNAGAPAEFQWKWVTGHRGTGCYHFGCSDP